MSFTLLTELQEHEVHRLSRFYWKEALRCEKSKAHLAGSVMLGSALEALLMLMVNGYADEVEATNVVPTRSGKPIPLVDWDLSQLLKVAKAAGWLPSGLHINDDWNVRKAKIGDYAEVSRKVRNLIHPGRYLKDHSPSRVTARYLQRQFEIVLLCRDWLAERNNKSLREHMRREGLL
jgi:hypothetical protein